MKHVFLVHSNITLIIAKGVIENQLLDSSNVILLMTRGMVSDGTFNSIDGNDFFQKLENINFGNFHKGWRQINKIDFFIKEKIKDNFVIYLPHFMHPFFQILSTSKKCVGVNVLEEGVNCLAKSIFDNTSSIKFLLINLFFNISGIYGRKRYFRVRSFIDFPTLGIKSKPVFYSITPNAFLEVDQFEKKKVNFSLTGFNNDKKNIDDNSTVFVFEAIVEQGNLSKSLFFESLHVISNDFIGQKIYVKFHPAQNQDNINEICEILKSKMEIIVLHNSVVLEFEFLRCKNLHVCGYVSSLLHYARIFEHKITSYSSLWEADKKFMNYRLLIDFPLPSH
jgi:hypothetical protein